MSRSQYLMQGTEYGDDELETGYGSRSCASA